MVHLDLLLEHFTFGSLSPVDNNVYDDLAVLEQNECLKKTISSDSGLNLFAFYKILNCAFSVALQFARAMYFILWCIKRSKAIIYLF